MCPRSDLIEDTQDTGELNCRPARPYCVSVIAPVKNEEASIGPLIEALLRQIYQPAEIIITDGGSHDRTREIIRAWQQKSHVPIVLIETAHAYPGRGRNLAIARARYEWVACIDAGIVPDADWLHELVQAAEREPDAQIIYGRFEAVTDTFFTECAAAAYVQPSERMMRFIASSLLHRSAWAAAGGFREDLRTGEDLLFFRSLAQAGVREAYSKGAVVYWSLRPSTGSTFHGFATSSRHSMRGGLAFNWQLSVSCIYLLMLGAALASFVWPPFLGSIPLVQLLRTERRLYRWYRARTPQRLWAKLVDPARVLMVTWINIVIDAAMFWGMLQWVLRDRIGAGLERDPVRGAADDRSALGAKQNDGVIATIEQ